MTIDEVRQRAIDLRKIYGVKGVSTLLNVDPAIVNAVLTASDDTAVSKVRGCVRHYWKPWMRLTRGASVINVGATKGKEKSNEQR
jgi:hypothetical protein